MHPTRPPQLYTRDSFRGLVLARDKHACVVCGATGVPLDAHHIMERRLWPDGGYYVDNGATLCDPECHTLAEQTLLSPEYLRERCGITTTLLPPHLYADTKYDKWGNDCLPNCMRLRGELFWDASVQAILAPVLHLFTFTVKAPRTWHLPWSPGATSDDRVQPDTAYWQGRDVVVTAKQDGENISIYGAHGTTLAYPNGIAGYCHARSTDPLSTPDCGRIKAMAAEVGLDLPDGWRLTGESLVRAHTITYTNLPAHPRWFFNAFNLWNERNVCLAWDDVVEWAELLGVPTVPVLYRGPWDEATIKALAHKTHNGDPMEGYVVRTVESFPFRDYRKAVGKYVHAAFRQPASYTPLKWRHAAPVFNAPRHGADNAQ